MADLSGLEVGDPVTLLRCLDHPAWSGRDPLLDEFIAVAKVTERRTDHFRGLDLVRVSNGHDYNLITGLQDRSEATRIVSASV
ncbi:MAG: hypothetical protein ACSLE6_12185 [Mycobacterium sp.]